MAHSAHAAILPTHTPMPDTPQGEAPLTDEQIKAGILDAIEYAEVTQRVAAKMDVKDAAIPKAVVSHITTLVVIADQLQHQLSEERAKNQDLEKECMEARAHSCEYWPKPPSACPDCGHATYVQDCPCERPDCHGN